ncbi:hypothetical protein Tco_0981634 [Tanacetum coccineum]
MTSSLVSYPYRMTKDLRLVILGTKPPSSIKGMISFNGYSVAIPFPLDSSMGGFGSLGRVGSLRGVEERIDKVILVRCLVNCSNVILVISGFWIGSGKIEFNGVGDGIDDDVRIKNFRFLTGGSSSETFFYDVSTFEHFSTEA